jgi:CO/xanthine dehydrogenase FAD-binding subunit
VGVDFVAPRSWADALAARAEHPGCTPIAGGTDVMVELNFDRHRPDVLLDLTKVPELREWSRADDGGVRLGAGVTYHRVMTELGNLAPGLAMASRTVGSPQIRARGTVGGNVGSASPAGDCHPVLLAVGATVEVESAARGSRRIPVADFFTGVKKSALEPDELIAAVLLPPTNGPQQFAKIGTRNAMVIAVCSLSLALHPEQRRVAACIGSAGPTPIRATEAEAFIGGVLEERGLWDAPAPLDELVLRRFGELVELAAKPISDVRGTAAYRSYAVGKLAQRTCKWAWDEWREGA